MSTMTSAWAWCGIMSVANATSASLNSADSGTVAVAVGSSLAAAAGQDEQGSGQQGDETGSAQHGAIVADRW